MARKTLAVPGTVYFECFDPDCTAVPRESGWPSPRRLKHGRGYRFIYEVTDAQRAEMLEHARDFGEAMSYGVDDPSIGRRIFRWAKDMSDAQRSAR